MAKKNITQPTKEDEKLLNDAMENSIDVVAIKGTNKKYKIDWLKKGTMRKISAVALEDKDDDTLSCKTAVLMVLNNYWKIKLFYWLMWRWWFYVKEYTDDQLSEILAMSKKKVPYTPFLINTILVTGMRDTIMRMTKEEAERFHQGLATAKQQQ